MPALQNKTYFNYGGQGPLPTPSLEAIKTSWLKIQRLGPFTNDVWPYISSEISTTKELLGKICGVHFNRISLTENVTTGCVLPLWGLPLIHGDHILISDCEHPGVIAACKELALRKGLQIDIWPVQQMREGSNQQDRTDQEILKSLESLIHPKTKLVVLSHLLWNTGQLMPIGAIADSLKEHPKKPFLLVDAAQSFGQIPIKDAASKVDIYAFTGHKWAFGPEGLGGVVLSERVILESNPTIIGWRSLKTEKGIYQSISPQFHLDGRRFEVATSCIPLLAGLRVSLNLLEKEGSEAQRLKKIKKFSSQLWEQLQGIRQIKTILNGPPPAGLISFSIKPQKSANDLVKKLGVNRFWIRMLEDPEWLRACLHITSTEDEIKELTEQIKRFFKKSENYS